MIHTNCNFAKMFKYCQYKMKMLIRQKPDLMCFKWRCVLVIWKDMVCIPLTLTGGKRSWQLDKSKRHIFTVRESVSNRLETVDQFLMRSGFVFPGNCLLFKRWRLRLTILKTKTNFHTSFICLFATTMTFLLVDFRLFFFYNSRLFVSFIWWGMIVCSEKIHSF